MGRESPEEDGLPTVSLLLEDVSGDGNRGNSTSSSDPSVTPLVVLSTLVALCGSFVSGCASGYSSPAESGIMEDLGLSTAAPALKTSFPDQEGRAAFKLDETEKLYRHKTPWKLA